MIMFPNSQTLTPNAACKRANRRGFKTTRVKDKITLYDHAGKIIVKDVSPNEVVNLLDTSMREAKEYLQNIETRKGK